MTVIPAKHTFTIWQGATFFEVLTLYETMDKTQPRDFCRQNNSQDVVSGVTVTTSNSTLPQVTLAFSGTPLAANATYSISSSTIPSANNISFTTGSSAPTSPYTATLSSTAGVTEGTTVAATITRRTLNYYADMIIRNKPQGTALHALRTSNHPNYNPVNDSLIILPIDPASKGQIQLKISNTTTATFGTSNSWKTGVYDLTITGISDQITQITDALLYGGIKVNGV
jgi:hypothetical protein